MKPWIVFAGGGTGGHLFPSLAVADALGGPKGEFDISFLVTDRRIDRQILDRTGYRFEPQVVRPLPRGPADWWPFWRAWRVACNAVRRAFVGRRPVIVVGSGGFGAGPPMRVAQRMSIVTALLNPDAVPGRANRYLARRASMIFVQWFGTRAHLPDRAAVHETGCPVRPQFTRADRQAGIETFGLDSERQTLLVTGASQGAHSINLAMLELTDFLAEAGARSSGAWQVLHLSGPADEKRVASAYDAAGVPSRVLSYTDEMAAAMSAADLILSRAGASTLAEITALGRASILLPYPHHRDQHQRANARALEDAGAAVMLADRIDARANGARLRPILEALTTRPDRLKAMKEAAARLGKPQAAQQVARLIRETCGL